MFCWYVCSREKASAIASPPGKPGSSSSLGFLDGALGRDRILVAILVRCDRVGGMMAEAEEMCESGGAVESVCDGCVQACVSGWGVWGVWAP